MGVAGAPGAATAGCECLSSAVSQQQWLPGCMQVREQESESKRSCGPLLQSPKTPQTPENTRKKNQIPHPRGWPPEMREKNTENAKTAPKIAVFGPFLYFFGIFSVFLGVNPGVGDLYFF